MGCVKAPGIEDRKRACISLIQARLRSSIRGSFHASPKAHFSGCLGIRGAGENQNYQSWWVATGLVFLIFCFAITLLKFVQPLWPFFSIAVIGAILSLTIRKWGFILSLIPLFALLLFRHPLPIDLFWQAGLSCSIALSWLVIAFGKEEALQKQINALSLQNQKIEDLTKRASQLEEQLKVAQIASLQLEKDSAKAIECIELEHSELQDQLANNRADLEKTLREAHEQIALLEQNKSGYERKIAGLQSALEDSQKELLQVKFSSATAQEPLENEQNFETLYKVLREQFDEKSEVLNQTRKQLFTVECQLLSLQKEWEDLSCDLKEEDRAVADDLRRADEDCRDLETEVQMLQEIISEIGKQKKVVRAVKPKVQNTQENTLPLLLQGMIDSQKTQEEISQ